MNNNVCCEAKVEKPMCVADYEKEISECLAETRDILKRDYKIREPTNEERIFLKSRGLILDSWLILYENKSELVVVSRRRAYRKVLKKPRKNR